MCYTSAAAAKAGALHALRSGILILLLPVLAMCSGISVVIYRSRDRFLGGVDLTSVQDLEQLHLFTPLDAGVPQERPVDNVLSAAGGPPGREHFDETSGGNGPVAANNGRPQVQL